LTASNCALAVPCASSPDLHQALPKRYHPMVDLLTEAECREMVEGTRRVLDNSTAVLPTHAEYIAKTCAAKGR